MEDVKEILEHLQENEREHAKHNLDTSDRLINKGWKEAFNFIFKNFKLTEKTINEGE